MAITRYSNFDKTVNTIADRNNIVNKVPGMTVVVLDAIADINVGTGKAIYRWDETDNSWILVSKGTADATNFITEELIITNNEINLSYIPVNNQVWNGLIIKDGLIYADLNVKQVNITNGKISNIPVDYNGMTLRITYAYGTIAAQVTTAIEAAVTEKFNDLSGFSIDELQTELDRTQLNIGLDELGNYVKSTTANYISNAVSVKDATEKLDSAIKTVSDSVPNFNNFSGNIIPSANGIYDIGSTTNRFKSIYVDEAYLSTNTLYIGDTPVLGTNADTIVVKADPDQSLLVKTSGLGTTNIESQTGVMLTTSGTNADVKIQATGVNSKVRFSGTGGIELSSNVNAQQDVAISGNLTVTGNLVANGSQFIVNSTTVTTKDNIITLNQGEIGSGVTAGKAGIQIDRGDSSDYQLVFDEVDDKFKVGQVGGTFETLATREYITNSLGTTFQPYNAGTVVDSNYVHTDNNYTTAEKTKLSGIESGAQVNTVTSVAGKTGAVTLTKSDVGLSNVDNTSDSSKPISTATQTALNLKVDKVGGKQLSTEDYTTADKTKLSGLSNYVKPTSEPISYISGLQTALDNKVEKSSKQSLDSTSALRVSGTTVSLYKGDGTFDSITTQDTIYTLPTATSTVKGGIEIFSDTVQTTAANTISTTSGRTYGIQLNSAGQAVVNVPWSDTNTVYTHPNSGVTAGTYSKVTVNTQGHITAGTNLSASDIPSLDASKITTGTIDAARLPSFVDDVLEYANLSAFPAVGEAGKIYIALDTNKTYRWSGSTYVYITSGAVDSVAGKTGVVTLVKGDVGLSNVDNTADSSKNVLSATKLATARSIALSGAVTGTATSFDGTGNISIPVTGINASNLNSGTVPDDRLSGVYSGMSLKLNGNNTVFTTESSGSTDMSRTVYGLAEYKNKSSSTTGAIVFIAPSSPSGIMHQLEVSGLLYNKNIVSLIVQGYRTTGAWSDLRKISTGTADIQVRWGMTPEGKNCLILGDIGTVWPYPHIAITRAMFSYNGVSDAYCTGWTVALVTDFTGYTNISADIADSTMIGNVSSATKLATARSISLSGDVTGTVSFDGSSNVSITATIADDSHNHIISNIDGLQNALDNKVDKYNISTSEYNTGVKRGNKDVFGIEVDLGSLPNSGTKDVAFTFNSAYTYWIDASNSYASSSSEVITLPYLGFIGDEVSVKLDRVNNKIVIIAAKDRTSLTGKLVILYTK